MDKVALPFPLLAFTTSVPALGVFWRNDKIGKSKRWFLKVPLDWVTAHLAHALVSGLDVAWCSASNFCQYIWEILRQKKIAKKDYHQSKIFKTRLPLWTWLCITPFIHSTLKKKNSSQGDQSDNNSHWLSLLTCPNQGSFPLEWFWPPGRCWRMLDSGWFSNTIEILTPSKCSTREFHLYVFS